MHEHSELMTSREVRAAMPSAKPASSRRRLVRVAAVFVAALLGILVIDCLLEPAISPFRVFDADFSPEAVQRYMTALARMLGVLLAATVTVCGIAIPLTANNYTPKLISMFVRDRINWAVFGLMVAANTLAHWTLLASAGDPLPLANVALSSALALVCLLVVTPYAFYVFIALMPQRIVTRIRREVDEELELLARGKARDPALVRTDVVQNIKYLSNITLRSIDRYDRDTALHSLEALRRLFDHYFDRKKDMPALWFRAQRNEFLAQSHQVIRQIEDAGTIFEVELLEECALVLSVAIGKFRDGVRMIGNMVRHMGKVAVAAGDAGAVEAVCTYFNSFIRAAISARNPDAIYMLVFQYRQLAQELIDLSPKDALRVAFYLDYYGHQAVRAGIVFVANLVAYDLAALVRVAFEHAADCRGALFELCMDFDRSESLATIPGVLKSRIGLAVELEALGQRELVERICRQLCRAPRARLEAAVAEIDSVTTPYFWEVTDRRLHLDFIPPEKKDAYHAVKACLWKAVGASKL